jgi:hypothetical protein
VDQEGEVFDSLQLYQLFFCGAAAAVQAAAGRVSSSTDHLV